MSSHLSEDDLVQQFQPFNRHPNPQNALYLEPKKAIELVQACQANDLCVIGFEGFELEGRLITPQLDLIADYSSRTDQTATDEAWEAYRTECNREAILLLEEQFEWVNLVIQLTIVSQAELHSLRRRRTQ